MKDWELKVVNSSRNRSTRKSKKQKRGEDDIQDLDWIKRIGEDDVRELEWVKRVGEDDANELEWVKRSE